MPDTKKPVALKLSRVIPQASNIWKKIKKRKPVNYVVPKQKGTVIAENHIVAQDTTGANQTLIFENHIVAQESWLLFSLFLINPLFA